MTRAIRALHEGRPVSVLHREPDGVSYSDCVSHHKKYLINDSYLHSHGIRDLESGIAVAETKFRSFRDGVADGIGRSPEITSIRMGLLSMVTRAQGYHGASIAAVREDNPYAAFTLVRCFAENAAALLWMMEKPGDLRRISLLAEESERFAVGRLISDSEQASTRLRSGVRRTQQVCAPSSIQLLRRLETERWAP